MAALAAKLARSTWFGPAVVAGLAAALVLAALDPAGDHPGGRDGPGLTVDEAFNVGQGVQLVDRLLAGDWNGFRAIDAGLPDHPPLGRLWIGACHEVAFLLSPPSGTAPYSITCARTAPALAFAATVFLVGWFAGRWFGPVAGPAASVSLVLMPRSFGHAHLAALESCINLAYAAVVLYLADQWGGPPRAAAGRLGAVAQHDRQMSAFPQVGCRTALIGGLLLGLALLTKIQAVLLPVPIAVWALCVMRKRALRLLPIWGAVALAVFLLGWPYLWSEPISHSLAFLGRTTQRAVIHVWYGGEAVADRDVPWHYPWVLWLTTVPVGLHLLGVWGTYHGLGCSGTRACAVLLLACSAFPLFVFSLPGVAVYDGERLFSVSYPLWAMLIGLGAARCHETVSVRFSPRWSGAVLACLFASQSLGLVTMAPAWLSYYNLLAGGPRGAERLGLPVTCWGDGVTRTLLDEVARHVPQDATVAVAPVLHEQQWNELLQQSPALKRGTRFAPLGSPAAAEAPLLLLFPRKEYLPKAYRGRLDPDRIVASVRRGGVVVAALCRIDAERR